MAGALSSCQDSQTPHLHQGLFSGRAFQLIQVEGAAGQSAEAGGTARYARMLRAPSPAGKHLAHVPRLRTPDSMLNLHEKIYIGSQLINGGRFLF